MGTRVKITGQKPQLIQGFCTASTELIQERRGGSRGPALSILPWIKSYWTFWLQVENFFVLNWHSPKASSCLECCLEAFSYFSKPWFVSFASELWVRPFSTLCILQGAFGIVGPLAAVWVSGEHPSDCWVFGFNLRTNTHSKDILEAELPPTQLAILPGGCYPPWRITPEISEEPW